MSRRRSFNGPPSAYYGGKLLLAYAVCRRRSFASASSTGWISCFSVSSDKRKYPAEAAMVVRVARMAASLR